MSDVTETEIVDATDIAATEPTDANDGDTRSASQLEEEGEIAADYIEELLDIADLDGDASLASECRLRAWGRHVADHDELLSHCP